jgi:hypothetical protein
MYAPIFDEMRYQTLGLGIVAREIHIVLWI